MPAALLYSAPHPNEERYETHIQRCMEKVDLVFPMFYLRIVRVLNLDSQRFDFESLKAHFYKMILFHDLGKLTRRWQERINPYKPPLPSHSTIGAAYLWRILPDRIKDPISFAVAIHHTDKGLLGDNIERPDVQAILDSIVDSSGNVVWHDETKNLTEDYFPKEARDLNVSALKDMARGLRVWAKGCGLLEQHQRRMQASFAHHILKLCDISAATERKEYQKKNDQDYYGGWLMVEQIKDYVDGISKRIK